MSKTQRGITLTPRVHDVRLDAPRAPFVDSLPPLLSLSRFALRLSLSLSRPRSASLAHALSLALWLARSVALWLALAPDRYIRRSRSRSPHFTHGNVRAHQCVTQRWCAWTCACVYTRINGVYVSFLTDTRMFRLCVRHTLCMSAWRYTQASQNVLHVTVY